MTTDRTLLTRCNCDTFGEPAFPHRPWCATQHQHPGPDCAGLCEPATTDRIPAPRADLTPVGQLHRQLTIVAAEREAFRRDLAEMTEARNTVQQTLATVTADLDHARRLNNQLAEIIGQGQRTIDAQAEQIRRDGTLLCRLRDLDEQRDRAWADHDTITAPAQDAVDGTRDVIGHPCEGGPLTDALEHAESAIIDSRDVIWRPVDGGGWTHPIYGGIRTPDQIDQKYGPIRTVLLVDIGQDDEQDTGLAATLAQIAREDAQVQADIAAGRVADQLGDPPPASHHITRGNSPSDIEADCPCPKAPCGGVDTRHTNPACEHHPADRAKTMRQMHRADRCPAKQEG